MKYSLMSLMIDKELKVKKPNFIHRLILQSMGYTGPEPTVDEMFAFFNAHGYPAKNGTLTFRDMVKFAKDNGFDGVDMMSFHFEEDGPTAAAALEEFGITFSAVDIIAPFSEAATEEDFERTLAGVKEIMDRAYEAGCRNVLLMPAGYALAPGLTREQAFWKMVRGLRAGVAYGEEKGMTVNTETLESAAIPLCSNGEMLRLYSEVKGLKYTHDTGNPLVACEDPVSTYELLKDRLAAVHFKDLEYIKGNPDDVPAEERYMNASGRFLKRAVLGEGEVDFKKHLEVLKRDGYQGFITIEGMRPADNQLDGAIKALEYFKKMETEI